ALVDQLIQTNYSSLADTLSNYCRMDRRRAEIVSELLASDPRPKSGYAQSLASCCAKVLDKPSWGGVILRQGGGPAIVARLCLFRLKALNRGPKRQAAHHNSSVLYIEIPAGDHFSRIPRAS